MSVRRIGGGYGAKISRQNVLAAAAAVAAKNVQQPVRVVTDLNTNMTLAGWRDPYYATYDVRKKKSKEEGIVEGRGTRFSNQSEKMEQVNHNVTFSPIAG